MVIQSNLSKRSPEFAGITDRRGGSRTFTIQKYTVDYSVIRPPVYIMCFTGSIFAPERMLAMYFATRNPTTFPAIYGTEIIIMSHCSKENKKISKEIKRM